jgi:membrane protein YqaA with SNARE-associated domain
MFYTIRNTLVLRGPAQSIAYSVFVSSSLRNSFMNLQPSRLKPEALVGTPPPPAWWQSPRTHQWIGIVSIALITIVSCWLALHPRWVLLMGRWGYLGAFVISLIASATIILPVPGLAVVIAMGNALDPVLLGLVAGIGSAFGELSGYWAGRSGRALIPPERAMLVKRLEVWTRRYGAFLLMVLALIPFPLFDLAGIVAGIMQMRMLSFLTSVAIGKSIKYIVLILLGVESIHLMQRWFG